MKIEFLAECEKWINSHEFTYSYLEVSNCNTTVTVTTGASNYGTYMTALYVHQSNTNPMKKASSEGPVKASNGKIG